MTREELLAKAKAKIARQQLVEKAKQMQNSTDPTEHFLEESPDALKWKDRAIAKNLANSPESQAAYIKQQYPDQQVTLNDGRVYMRRDNKEPWQALDPDTGFFSKDIIQDVGDMAFDIPAAVAQTAATTSAGAAGGVATLPSGGWGAVPAAMAASGVTGGGLEAFRQKLGQKLGIPQEVDTNQVLTTGAISAVAPAIMGAGNITKAPLMKNMSADAMETLIKAQRGYVGRGVDAVAPMLSSVPRDAINAYSKHGQAAIDAITDNGGMINYLDDVSNKATSAIVGNKRDIGKQMSAAYQNGVTDVPLTSVKDSFLDAMAKLEKTKSTNPGAWTPALEERLATVKAGYQRTIPQVNTLDANSAFDLQQTLKKLNNNFELKADPNNIDFLSAVNGAYSQLNNGLDTATAGVSSKLKGQYKDAIGLEDLSGSSFDDGQKLYNTLSNMDKGAKLQFKEQVVPRVKDLGVDLMNPYENVQSFKYFADPKLLPISNGSTSTTYTNTLGRLGGNVGGAAAGVISPSATSVGMGQAIGDFAGSIAASPKVTKFAIDASKKQKAPFYLNQNSATLPFLEYMLNEKNANQP